MQRSLQLVLFLTAYWIMANSLPTVADSTELYELTQNWQYCWDESKIDSAGLPARIFDSENDSKWQNIDIPYNPPQRKGNRKLWLRYKLPHEGYDEPTIFLTNIFLAFNVFLDKKKIESHGRFVPDIHKFSATNWQMFTLPGNYQ